MMKMPTIEDVFEMSGIEVLHPGGYDLSKRIGEVMNIKNKKVLDVASGRGAFACYYALNYHTHVTGIDINPDMVKSSVERAKKYGVESDTEFKVGDALSLPFDDNTFDAAINECAVGLTAHPQKCLDEMVRVVKPGGDIVIHENTWLKQVSEDIRRDTPLRLGTVPFQLDEWMHMMKKAGMSEIWTEDWSSIERSIVKMRVDREVKRLEDMYTLREMYLSIFPRIFFKYGLKGIVYLNESNTAVIRLYYSGTLGYYLIKGKKPL